jgi:hypothetical protein
VTGFRQYDWERVYDAEEYIELLSTFSNHLTMENWQRDRLYGEIRRRLAQRPDRSVRRGWMGGRCCTWRGGGSGRYAAALAADRGAVRWIWPRNSALEAV